MFVICINDICIMEWVCTNCRLNNAMIANIVTSMTKKPIDSTEQFQAAQKPIMWFLSAERLRDAAEIILSDQIKQEVPFFRAVEEAQFAAMISQDKSAQIACLPPNYRPGQLLYAFAMENALKGLMIARNQGLVSSRHSISKSIKSHDLLKLANDARFSLAVQEVSVLKALSHISEWAGRYPVATAIDKYNNPENPYPLGLEPDVLLDWGSQHPIMRECLGRMMRELEKALPSRPNRFGTWVAFKQVE